MYDVTRFGLVNKGYVLFQSHTILLVQPSSKPEGRTYSDYEAVNEMLEGKTYFFYFLSFDYQA